MPVERNFVCIIAYIKREIPCSEERFRGEDSKSRALVLRSDLVISELLNEFRLSYHDPAHRRWFSGISDLTIELDSESQLSAD
nr:hypothetical protein Iba_chr02cCG5700 [Ipomoea batatas]